MSRREPAEHTRLAHELALPLMSTFRRLWAVYATRHHHERGADEAG